MLFTAASYGKMAATHPVAGSAYTYVRKAVDSRLGFLVGWAVLLNNIEALLILLDCGYVIATTLAISGFLARWMIEGWFLSFVGLARDTGPVGDILRAYRFIQGWIKRS